MRKTAVIYARISMIDEKSGINVEKTADQVKLMTEEAEKLDADVIGKYVDDGISAKESGLRPHFDKMLFELPTLRPTYLLSTEESRIARNMAEKTGVMLACASTGTIIKTKRDGTLDPRSAQGQFMGNIRGAVDAFEVARKAERQIQENANTRAKGRPFRSGARPFGFLDDRMTMHPVEGPLIQSGVKQILDGVPLSSVTAAWRSSNVRPPRARAWTNISVRSVLTKWSIAGVVEHKDEPVGEGIEEWQRIVTREQLEAVRVILTAKGARQRAYAKTMLSGLARCHCGDPLVSNGSAVTRQKSGRSATYVCTTRVRGIRRTDIHHVGIAAELIEPLAVAQMVDIYLATPEQSGSADAESTKLAELHVELGKAQTASKRLHDHYFGDDNSLSAAEFKKRDAVNKAREQSARDAIEMVVSASAHASMLVKSQLLLRHLTEEMRRSQPHVANYFEVRSGARRDVEQAWLQLPLVDQRALIAANLSITVGAGKGADRVVITRKRELRNES
jgi:site-specific DNA recombinase